MRTRPLSRRGGRGGRELQSQYLDGGTPLKTRLQEVGDETVYTRLRRGREKKKD